MNTRPARDRKFRKLPVKRGKMQISEEGDTLPNSRSTFGPIPEGVHTKNARLRPSNPTTLISEFASHCNPCVVMLQPTRQQYLVNPPVRRPPPKRPAPAQSAGFRRAECRSHELLGVSAGRLRQNLADCARLAMQIFWLKASPADSAAQHLPIHVHKLCLEITQLLFYAMAKYPGWYESVPVTLRYKAQGSHKEHPLAYWVAACRTHFRAALELGQALGQRFERDNDYEAKGRRFQVPADTGCAAALHRRARLSHQDGGNDRRAAVLALAARSAA